MAALLLMAGTAAAERIDKSEALKIASEFFGTAAGRTTPSTVAKAAAT